MADEIQALAALDCTTTVKRFGDAVVLVCADSDMTRWSDEKKYEPAAHVRRNCYGLEGVSPCVLFPLVRPRFHPLPFCFRWPPSWWAALQLVTTRWVRADPEARVELDFPMQARHPPARAALADQAARMPGPVA